MTEFEIDRQERIEAGIREALHGMAWRFERVRFSHRAPSSEGWIIVKADGTEIAKIFNCDVPSWVPPQHLMEHARTLVDRMTTAYICGHSAGRRHERLAVKVPA